MGRSPVRHPAQYAGFLRAIRRAGSPLAADPGFGRVADTLRDNVCRTACVVTDGVSAIGAVGVHPSGRIGLVGPFGTV